MMKILIALLLAICLLKPACSLAEGITLSVNNENIEKVFKEIQLQTIYRFVYTNEDLVGAVKVSFTVKDGSLETVLELCFKDQPLVYSIDKLVILVRKKATPFDRTTIASAESVVRGTVLNEQEEPLQGATIAVKGTQRAVQSNREGEFMFPGVQQKDILVVSNVGYEPKQTRPVFNGNLTVKLNKVDTKLDEVQVIAYGSTTSRLNTGDVTTIKSDIIREQPVSNVLEALEGRVSGMYITQSTGVPGGAFSLQLRGQNSISNGNDPLYLIDGVPFTSTSINSYIVSGGITGGGNPLNSINPADIESVEILKDADATAIYGSRGANGVVLITTKKGKAGKTSLDINFYSGAGKITRSLKLLSTPQYLQMRDEAFKNDGETPQSYDYDLVLWDSTRNTDWKKLLIGNTSHINNLQLGLSGGNSNTQFLLHGGYSRQTTVFPGDYYDEKISMHANINHVSSNQKLKINFSASYLSDNNNLLSQDLTYAALTLAPDAPPLYDSLGKLNWAGGSFSNPFAQLLQKYKSKTGNLVGNILLSYELVKGLQCRINAGYTNMQIREFSGSPTTSLNPYYGNPSSAEFSTGSLETWIAEPLLNYSHKSGFGNVDVVAGATFQQSLQDGSTIYGSGFSSDALLGNIAAAKNLYVFSATNVLYRYNAFFGRINYNYGGKYLLNFTGRRDGSSRFGPGKQFANFGAVGAAWIFSEEKWVKQQAGLLSFGKLRGSYGTTGNDQIGDYKYLDSYTTTSLPYQNNPGLYPLRLFNPAYGWETNRKLEAGLQLGFFKDRLLASASWYQNRSSNQLVGYTLAPTTGFTSIQANLPATVQNTGVEMEVTTVNIKGKNFTWTTAFNITFPDNKLLSFPNLASSSYADQYLIGKSLNIVQAFHADGVDPQTGLYQFEDKSGKPTTNPVYPDDNRAVYSIAQKYYGGLQNKFVFGGWQLDIFFQFVKQTGRNYLYSGLFPSPGMMGNQPAIVMSRWQKPGDHSNVQQFTQDYNSVASYLYSTAAYSGDNNVGDASFIRLKNIFLAYQLPARWAANLHLQGVKFYVQGQNLITITKFQGMDPENNLSVGSLPPLKMLSAGIQINL